jgi:hypothetical protein
VAFENHPENTPSINAAEIVLSSLEKRDLVDFQSSEDYETQIKFLITEICSQPKSSAQSNSGFTDSEQAYVELIEDICSSYNELVTGDQLKEIVPRAKIFFTNYKRVMRSAEGGNIGSSSTENFSNSNEA